MEISEFFTSEERSSSNFGNLVIDEKTVREGQQPAPHCKNKLKRQLNQNIVFLIIII